MHQYRDTWWNASALAAAVATPVPTPAVYVNANDSFLAGATLQVNCRITAGQFKPTLLVNPTIDTVTFPGHTAIAGNGVGNKLRSTSAAIGTAITPIANTGAYTIIHYIYLAAGSQTRVLSQIANGTTSLNNSAAHSLNLDSGAATFRYNRRAAADQLVDVASTYSTLTKFFVTYRFTGTTVEMFRDMTSLGSSASTANIGATLAAVSWGGSSNTAGTIPTTLWLLAMQIHTVALTNAQISAAQTDIASTYA